MGNNIFLKTGLEILIQLFKMFPFSGSRAELYLAARPPFTGIAKKTGYSSHRKQDQPIHLVLLAGFTMQITCIQR